MTSFSSSPPVPTPGPGGLQLFRVTWLWTRSEAVWSWVWCREQAFKGHSGLLMNGEVTSPQKLSVIKKTTVTVVRTLRSTEGLKGTQETPESEA